MPLLKLLLHAALYWAVQTQAEIVVTTVALESNTYRWKYLYKFCFDVSGGVFTSVALTYPQAPRQKLLLYSDIDWDKMNSASSDLFSKDLTPEEQIVETCQTRESHATWQHVLNEDNIASKVGLFGSRPRWWYVAIQAPCGVSEPGKFGLRYLNMTFTNENSGIWARHFSKDKQGIYEIAITFTTTQFILFCALVYSKRAAKLKALHYQGLKICMASVAFQLIDLFLVLVDRTIFAQRGYGAKMLQDLAFFSNLLSQLALLILVVNVSKGWGISTNYIPFQRQTFAIVMFVVAIYTIIFAIEAFNQDALQKQSSANLVLMVLYSLVLLPTITYNWCKTLKTEKQTVKRKFYKIFFVFTVIFILTPTVTQIFMSYLDSWVQEKVGFGIKYSAQSVCQWWALFSFQPFCGLSAVLKPGDSVAFANNNMQIFPHAGTPKENKAKAKTFTLDSRKIVAVTAFDSIR